LCAVRRAAVAGRRLSCCAPARQCGWSAILGQDVRVKRALLVVIGAFLVHAWWLNCLAEDAYITYRFARNVAEGHGFVWNVGEPPIEGFTNFLWLLLCAAADRLHLDLPRFTQAVGLIAATITIAATWLFSRQVLKLSKPAALFAVTLLA